MVFLVVRFGVRERYCLNRLEWILLKYGKSAFEFDIRKIKLLDDKGDYIQGAIGVGFGAWSRAGYIQKICGLRELPESVSREDWLRMDGIVRLVPWKV